MSDMVTEGRRTFERYAAIARNDRSRILSERPQYDGVGVRIGDDLARFPLAYGITNRGGLRRFTDLMYEMHKHEGIAAVLEIVDDVNFGLPQEAATVITLHQAARVGRRIFFNLDGIQEVDEILADRGRWRSNITALELRYIRDNWEEFRGNITFWKNDAEVPPPVGGMLRGGMMIPRNRYLGCMIGLAVGDALGFPVEFERNPRVTDMTSPLYSDDTQMSIATAEGILNGGSIEDIHRAYLAWRRTQDDPEAEKGARRHLPEGTRLGTDRDHRQSDQRQQGLRRGDARGTRRPGLCARDRLPKGRRVRCYHPRPPFGVPVGRLPCGARVVPP